MTTSRKYWVVSPNVDNKNRTVSEWIQASVRWQAAFMGWHPDDQDHKLGPKFAHEIRPGDLILIARRYRKEPQIVGFGIVVEEFKTHLRGFEPPQSFGSLRQLDPFVPMSHPPKHPPFINDALNHTASLRQLHPENNHVHKELCDWMERKLAISNAAAPKEYLQEITSRVQLRSLPNDAQLEYQVRTLRSVKQAIKKEADLVIRYRQWLERQDRELQIFKSDGIQCDSYEQTRKNLIEAKCSAKREYIRMAVGQLLDYAFQAKHDLGNCHKAILLPEKPDAAILEWLKSLEISAIWEENSVFLDNLDGQFT
ncbi:hypothetical protein FTO74_16955 [Granulicella sp. WH15]|uniref:hypothetical protein n=1 Tax=Granulicella sp. WH15 TaxID=2602070 RepID=UPI00136700E5|nr:hypothetical protein [Granulicella sp. WH15]QHN04860.1 hypothetical protein FTO74_16955 [Granulicella sp. WH15]